MSQLGHLLSRLGRAHVLCGFILRSAAFWPADSHSNSRGKLGHHKNTGCLADKFYDIVRFNDNWPAEKPSQ